MINKAVFCLILFVTSILLGGLMIFITDSSQDNIQRNIKAPDAVIHGEAGKLIDEFMSTMNQKGYAGIVLVAKGEQVILNKGYGFANRNRKISFTCKSIISLGSITKQLTAIAILRLQMKGQLNVKDKIEKYFKDTPKDKSQITIHHLLTHSSGLLCELADDFDLIPRDEYVHRVLNSKLEFNPGDKFAYSNVGYSLLGIIIEIVSGQSYEDYIQKYIFEPSNMTQTGYAVSNWRPSNIAHGYQGSKHWGTILERIEKHGLTWNLRANGGIHTTTEDIFKLHISLENEKILSKESQLQCSLPYIKIKPGLSYGYAYFVREDDNGSKITNHAGSNGIFHTLIERYFSDDLIIFVASNDSEKKCYDWMPEIRKILKANKIISY